MYRAARLWFKGTMMRKSFFKAGPFSLMLACGAVTSNALAASAASFPSNMKKAERKEGSYFSIHA